MMKKRLISGLLTVVLVAGLLAGCGGSASSGQEGSDRQDTSSVVVAMGPTSEPEAGFDPAYGWGAGSRAPSR